VSSCDWIIIVGSPRQVLLQYQLKTDLEVHGVCQSRVTLGMVMKILYCDSSSLLLTNICCVWSDIGLFPDGSTGVMR
jgi:hypothetical protein